MRVSCSSHTKIWVINTEQAGCRVPHANCYCGPKTLSHAQFLSLSQNDLPDPKMVIEIKGHTQRERLHHHVHRKRNVGTCCLGDCMLLMYVTLVDDWQCMPAEYVHRPWLGDLIAQLTQYIICSSVTCVHGSAERSADADLPTEPSSSDSERAVVQWSS